jgi:AraC-like DNA-binding protein
VLREANQLAHRRSERPARARSKPRAVCADAPNQLYSWDITYLPATIRGQFFYLYLFLDVFSRKIVGWQVYAEESSALASEVLRDLCAREAIQPEQVILHSDNGGPMKGATMLRWLQDNCHRAVSVNDAAEACAMSQRTLLRNFQTYIGASPSEYLQRVRLERACQLLAETSLPADKVARRVGLTNGDRLGKLFRRCMGKSPIEYRAWTRGNADANGSNGETTVSAHQQLALATCDE